MLWPNLAGRMTGSDIHAPSELSDFCGWVQSNFGEFKSEGSCSCGQSQQRQTLGKHNQFLPLLSLTCCHSFTNTFQRKRAAVGPKYLRALPLVLAHQGAEGLGHVSTEDAGRSQRSTYFVSIKGSWSQEPVRRAHVPAVCSLQNARKHSQCTCGSSAQWERTPGPILQIAATETFEVWFTANWLFVVGLLRVIRMGHPCQGTWMPFCQTASKLFPKWKQLLLLSLQMPLQVS